MFIDLARRGLLIAYCFGKLEFILFIILLNLLEDKLGYLIKVAFCQEVLL